MEHPRICRVIRCLDKDRSSWTWRQATRNCRGGAGVRAALFPAAFITLYASRELHADANRAVTAQYIRNIKVKSKYLACNAEVARDRQESCAECNRAVTL
jgi:hypothetical protein